MASGGGPNTGNDRDPDDVFASYSGQGADKRVIDSNTIVRNLRTEKLEIREKVFEDKPVRKQLIISLEDDKQVAGRLANNDQGYFTNVILNQQ